jgi:hypothetical protein
LIPKLIASSVAESGSESAGDANGVGVWKAFKSITFSRGAAWVMIRPRIWLPFVSGAIKRLIEKGAPYAD